MKSVKCVVLCLLVSTFLGVKALKWQDADTITIEAEPEKSSRNKRQFVHILDTYISLSPQVSYPHGNFIPTTGNEYEQGYGFENGNVDEYQNYGYDNSYYQGGGYAGPSSSQSRRCYTTNREVGVCAKLSDCYPVLYTMDVFRGERNITNNPLAEDLLYSSGFCSNNPQDIRNNIICCPTFRQNRYPTQQPNTPTVKEVPTPPQCGLAQTKVVNGQEAKRGNFPWIVALINNGRQFCGGSLIDDYHVITAAHCVSHMNGQQVQNLRLYLGAHDLYSALEQGRVVARVSSIKYHRGFSHQTLLYDIAIMRLSTPIRYWNYNNINAICLTTGRPPYDVNYPWARLAGWGQLRYKGPQPSRLQHVDVQVWPNNVCAQRLGRIPPAGLQPHMVCASGSGGKDACNGDSGGPLMRWMNNRVEQIGVVSWGVNCGVFPGVYTRVDHFTPWLNKNRLS